jgi:hypothetical protein
MEFMQPKGFYAIRTSDSSQESFYSLRADVFVMLRKFIGKEQITNTDIYRNLDTPAKQQLPRALQKLIQFTLIVPDVLSLIEEFSKSKEKNGPEHESLDIVEFLTSDSNDAATPSYRLSAQEFLNIVLPINRLELQETLTEEEFQKILQKFDELASEKYYSTMYTLLFKDLKLVKSFQEFDDLLSDPDLDVIVNLDLDSPGIQLAGEVFLSNISLLESVISFLHNTMGKGLLENLESQMTFISEGKNIEPERCRAILEFLKEFKSEWNEKGGDLQGNNISLQALIENNFYGIDKYVELTITYFQVKKDLQLFVKLLDESAEFIYFFPTKDQTWIRKLMPQAQTMITEIDLFLQKFVDLFESLNSIILERFKLNEFTAVQYEQYKAIRQQFYDEMMGNQNTQAPSES